MPAKRKGNNKKSSKIRQNFYFFFLSPPPPVNVLFQVSASDLVNAGFAFQTFDPLPYPFKPVVDDFAGDPFLPEEPLDVILKVRTARSGGGDPTTK